MRNAEDNKEPADPKVVQLLKDKASAEDQDMLSIAVRCMQADAYSMRAMARYIYHELMKKYGVTNESNNSTSS